jgi:hypothetical protein
MGGVGEENDGMLKVVEGRRRWAKWVRCSGRTEKEKRKCGARRLPCQQDIQAQKRPFSDYYRDYYRLCADGRSRVPYDVVLFPPLDYPSAYSKRRREEEEDLFLFSVSVTTTT